MKNSIDNLACFGGGPLFATPISTSSLAQPDLDCFLYYSQQFFSRKHYTNNGVLVKLLEKRLAEFHEVNFCITFCSGFWALVLAISAIANEGKSEIIMPSLTYRRMADIAAWTKLKPRFCEVNPETLALDPESVKSNINSETALILGVHPIVNCCDVSGLLALGKEYDIPLLFDSVESVYETIGIGKIGGFGEAECFSMHASKLLNGFEGGYVTTNNEELAHQLALMRSFGFEGQDNCVLPGALNAKLNEIHAAMALANLDEIERLVNENRERYRAYQVGLKDIPGINLLEFNESMKTSFKNIVIEVNDAWPLSRNQTVSILNAENILARAYYSPPLHRKEMRYPHIEANLAITDQLSEQYILLPSGDFITVEDIHQVTEFLRFIQKNASSISMRLSH